MTNNTVSRVGGVGILVVGGASGRVADNVVTGPGTAERPGRGPAGIVFFDRATGSVTANTVAQHRNDHREAIACGIHIGQNAGEVEVSGNRFPTPGNEVNLCDDRVPKEEEGEATPEPMPKATPEATPEATPGSARGCPGSWDGCASRR